MKILSTEGLTKLIQLIKGTFVSNNDISTVARTGDYVDLINKPTIPSRTSELYNDSGYVNSTALNNKQDRLISGSNIKTINGNSVLGSGDLVIQSGGDPINNRDGVSHLPMWEGTQTQWNQYSNSNWYCWEAEPTPVWSEGGELPNSAPWQSIAYGDGVFVAITYDSDKAAYSTDGINWIASTLPSSADWYSVTYGNGTFVAITYGSDKAAYSTDGINWIASTLPSSTRWLSVTYGDGKFVAVVYSSDKTAYSTDGINWTSSTMPTYASWQSVTYGDGKFVAVAGEGSNESAYSTDGINWTESTLPSYASWYSVTYGNGTFVAITYGSNKSAYSTDGINWTESTLPTYASWCSVTYGDNKFVAVTNGSDDTAIFSMSAEGETCYTLDENPTTSSIVYESPNNRSNLTVTSYDSGLDTLTLSDGNTYEYTASSDITAWRNVADAHPDWLCNIEGVGVKMGNTMIANEGSVVAGCTNAEIQNIWENN